MFTRVLLTLVFALCCCAQTVLSPGVVVTGQCQGHESEPGCVIPNTYGPTGLNLSTATTPPHYAHFIGAAQQTLNQSLGTAIATQLAILPIISPSSGFTYKYDSGTGAFVRTSASFGPIYTERAETIGRGKFSFGTSYQRFRFSSLDGINLHKVPAVFTHIPVANDPPYENDVISTSNNIDLKMDQTMLYGTVGITDRLDFSVAIPLVSVRMGVISDATIIRVSGDNPIINGSPIPNPHSFQNGSLRQSFPWSGSAFGIGDVTLRVKAGILNRRGWRLAGIMDVRTPSGDARKLLGAGATGVKPFLALSGSGRLAPHINLGYQWNGSSILAGNITGSTFSENSSFQETVTNGPSTSARLPSQVFYSVGADYGATKRLTLVFDYLGQTLFNSPVISRSQFTTANIPTGPGSQTLPTISGQKETSGLNNGAIGLKYNLFGQLLLTGNVLFRLDDNGLRQNVTPLVALSYAFGR
jgi:hypothetical protein